MLLQAIAVGIAGVLGYALYKRAPKKGYVPEYYDQQVSSDFAPSKVGIPPPTPRRFMSIEEGGKGQTLSSITEKDLFLKLDTPKMYSPSKGDYISAIGQRFGINPDALIEFNRNTNPNNPAALTFTGKIIKIPWNLTDSGPRYRAMGVIRQPGD